MFFQAGRRERLALVRKIKHVKEGGEKRQQIQKEQNFFS